jgi:DNA (cytosine-5)-methyltransferase 1
VKNMIANAVPSPLAEAIGKIILDRDGGKSIPKLDASFAESRETPSNPALKRKA